MKHLIAAALFLVTWQEHVLKPIQKEILFVDLYQDNVPEGYCLMSKNGRGKLVWVAGPNSKVTNTVETVTKTIKLATMKDVDLFIGPDWCTPNWKPGLIGSSAFNIRYTDAGDDSEIVNLTSTNCDGLGQPRRVLGAGDGGSVVTTGKFTFKGKSEK